MNPFHCHRHEPAGSRREFLSKWGMGFGSLLVLLSQGVFREPIS